MNRMLMAYRGWYPLRTNVLQYKHHPNLAVVGRSRKGLCGNQLKRRSGMHKITTVQDATEGRSVVQIVETDMRLNDSHSR